MPKIRSKCPLILMNHIILVGGGGHARACIDVIEKQGLYRIAGIVTREKQQPANLLGYPILGTDEDLPSLLSKTPHALITIGQIKDPSPRIRLFHLLKSFDAILPVIQSPSAYCSGHALIEEGSILMHGCIVNASAQIGKNCIINTQALVEHDTHVGDNCHISTGARINGGVTIQQNCFIGSGTVLKEGINVGQNAIIGAGQTVLRDVPAGSIIKG